LSSLRNPRLVRLIFDKVHSIEDVIEICNARRCQSGTSGIFGCQTHGFLVKSESTMRRALCTLLILLSWLGPFAELIPASAESRLPPCCRRHGTHHCSMSGGLASRSARASSASSPELTPSTLCSKYPGSLATSTGPAEALAALPAPLPVLLTEDYSPATIRSAARMSVLRTRSDRGPPVSNIG